MKYCQKGMNNSTIEDFKRQLIRNQKYQIIVCKQNRIKRAIKV